MWSDRLSAPYRARYATSPYRDRIDHVAGALCQLGYQEIVITEYVKEWLRFTHDLEATGLGSPLHAGAPEIATYLAQRFPTGSPSRIRFIRAAVRIWLDTDAQGRFPRRIRPPEPGRNALFHAWVPGYVEFLQQHRGVSERTLRKTRLVLGELTEFLERQGLQAWPGLQPRHLHAFGLRADGRKAITRAGHASILRRFLQYLSLQGGLERDLSAAVLTVRSYRLAALRDTLTDQELVQLLEAVDRSTAIGRRDYAVLLLVARYGLRPSDIRHLSLDDLHWRRGQIALVQSKTGRPLVLPLLPDVAEALIAYLQAGRPVTTARQVFVRHKAPFEPFAPHDNLVQIMRTALHRAGMGERPGRRGLYLLRHTLATRLLRSGLSLKAVADVLGQARTDSALHYTKLDLDRLRAVPLSMEEVRR